jgi:uncharacterized membrane protein YedE/YeeE
MIATTFADPGLLAMGAATGLVFGFLLQKGGVTQYDVIVNQFRLKDFTMLKVFVSAIVVGGVGIYGMRVLGMDVKMHIKTAAVLGNLIGGGIFGIGMVVLGFCPGTGVAALGQGSWHALPGVVGMVAGAALYAEVHGWASEHLLGTANLGKETFPMLTGLSPWWIIALVFVVAVIGFGLLEMLERRRRTPAAGSL